MRVILLSITIIGMAYVAFPSGARSYEDPRQMTTINTDEFSFRASILGDPEDDPVILLHGFPETSFMWRNLQVLLSENGFYSVAPDQRGYCPDARPKAKKHYALDLLAGDIIAIADSLDLEKFHLIGHDWGSAAGWAVAAAFPERILSWTAISVPHPAALAVAIDSDPAQYKASEYMRLFQWPLIPEITLKAGDYKRLRSIWDQSSREEIEAYLSVFSQPGGLTAALNWYRANYGSLSTGDDLPEKVSTPTLFIWGKQDPAILRSGVNLNSEYVTGSYAEHFIDAGHWLIQESYSEVSRLILEQLQERRE